MLAEAPVELFLAPEVPDDLFAHPLPDEIADGVVERLKAEADRHWYIDPRRSLAFADRIITIGQNRNDQWQIALGMMARGDALKFMGQSRAAWDTLEEAGRIFQSAGDEVGWARTRIGRLYAGLRLSRVAEALRDAEQAAAIFQRTGEHERLLRLHLTTADLLNSVRRYPQALDLLQSSLTLIQNLGETGQQYESVLLLNIGNTFHWQGQFAQALADYERARALASARGEILNVALAESNISMIYRDRGEWRQALLALERALSDVPDKPNYQAIFKKDIVECYLRLNRNAEARELAREVVLNFRALNDAHDLARTLLKLAVAEAALGGLTDAHRALDEAETLFTKLGALPGAATARLWRGQIALKQGHLARAESLALAAADELKAGGQLLEYASAVLLLGQTTLLAGNPVQAAIAGRTVLDIARQNNLSSLRYAAYTLLGRSAETQGHELRAKRHYRAAMATLSRAHRHLTITLRPTFLEDKRAAQRALIALHLRHGEVGSAFETLERGKAQALLVHLSQQDQLIWRGESDRQLIEELERLRSEHHWYYDLATEPGWQRSDDLRTSVTPEQARAEVATREKRIRAITEQLYLHSGGTVQGVTTASVREIQARLGTDTTLIAYHSDEDALWAFVMTADGLSAQPVPASMAQVGLWISQFHQNTRAALQMEESSPAARPLIQSARRLLRRLYDALITPLGLTATTRRLVFVPTGPLYLLPFHALDDGTTYLLERCEVVVQPAASLLCQPAPRRAPGVLALAHSWNGRLPNALTEAQQIRDWLGGVVYAESTANRAVLRQPPVQVLHIAAHGQHRLDQPELSYLHLADGQLYADDLFQQDLSYELVTLSACETGQAQVVVNDELIGLSRGFLYAGAGALILSLWPVADWAALKLMEPLYRQLRAGVSKAGALRAAQLALLTEHRQRHPAHWAAFQLVGNPAPLSTSPTEL
ncbi:MAG: CHAT domain-containing tetratricopeptide repeat protein [Anaerolineales bacterium]